MAISEIEIKCQFTLLKQKGYSHCLNKDHQGYLQSGIEGITNFENEKKSKATQEGIKKIVYFTATYSL